MSSHLPGTVVYGPPPAKWTGSCQTGLGFTTSMCNNKLIGARYFNTGWKANRPPAQWWSFEYIDSPRDSDGHGSHTLSTAGGNENVSTLVGGTNAVTGMSGIAPRARVASYKVCYVGNLGPGVAPSGCFGSDSVAAIEQAVADGADVINYSISGSRTSFRDAVETAFRNAAAAGVYVSASAGNTAGASTVAHNSPWIMTVGNSTHNRYTEAVVTLGSGATVQGASFQTHGPACHALLVWSRNVGFGAPAAAELEPGAVFRRSRRRGTAARPGPGDRQDRGLRPGRQRAGQQGGQCPCRGRHRRDHPEYNHRRTTRRRSSRPCCPRCMCLWPASRP